MQRVFTGTEQQTSRQLV